MRIPAVIGTNRHGRGAGHQKRLAIVVLLILIEKGLSLLDRIQHIVECAIYRNTPYSAYHFEEDWVQVCVMYSGPLSTPWAKNEFTGFGQASGMRRPRSVEAKAQSIGIFYT